MLTSVTTIIAVLAAFVSVACAVAALFILRRGSDAELKGDVNDLTTYVERLARDVRREKMSRVRSGRRVAEEAAAMEIPPGAENFALESSPAVTTGKDELRRRVLASRGIRV